MAGIAESSSLPPESMNGKPVVVRVKRKASQSRLEAFWLEINERPLKRPLLDFGKLSLSDSTGKEELKTKKVLVQHVETVHSSEVAIDVLQAFVPNPDVVFECKTKSDERRHTFKSENKRDQLLFKSRQKQEVLAKNARFQQIWRSRKTDKEAKHDKALHEFCDLYDVIRVDVEEASSKAQDQEEMSLEDQLVLRKYLPLLREFIPSAAEEIEFDIRAYMSEQTSADDYVYDLYTVKDDVNVAEEDPLNPFPLVQVDDDTEFYGGPPESEYESDDSNAEDNPQNDYPDEDSCEDEDVEESEASEDETEELESGNASNESQGSEDLSSPRDCSKDADPLFEDEFLDDYDDVDHHGYDGDDGDGELEDWI